MKKMIIATSIVILVFVIGILFYKADDELSKEEFISLMKNFENVSNVKIEGSSTKYIKDGYMLSIMNNGVGIYTWSNSKTKECISYIPSEKIYSYIEYGESEYSELNDAQYSFKGYKKYNDIECAVGEFKLEKEWTVEIWIDSKKGTCLKTININVDSNGKKRENEENYTAIYNVVKDDDVRKPDLTGYTEINN